MLYISDEQIIDLIAAGYDTVPKICKYLLGVPEDFRMIKLDYDDYEEYNRMKKYYIRRCNHMAKRRELVKTETGPNTAMIWALAE